jgi:hypothetical protein
VNECHSVASRPTNEDVGRTAFLVDEVWPEFNEYVHSVKTDRDLLLLARLMARDVEKPNYSWKRTDSKRLGKVCSQQLFDLSVPEAWLLKARLGKEIYWRRTSGLLKVTLAV